jgi:hypothetical protein
MWDFEWVGGDIAFFAWHWHLKLLLYCCINCCLASGLGKEIGHKLGPKFGLIHTKFGPNLTQIPSTFPS